MEESKLKREKSKLKIPRCTICKKEIENISEQYEHDKHETYLQCPECKRVWKCDDRTKKVARV